jgi:hypothetical protein
LSLAEIEVISLNVETNFLFCLSQRSKSIYFQLY